MSIVHEVPDVDDARLLDAYALRRDRAALSQLIARHLPFIYASALRQMHGDAHAAEDVAQAVCILLAIKPPRLRHSTNPSAAVRNWLFVTTRYAAKNATKMHNRRTYHERHAARLRAEPSDASHVDPSNVDALLDDALANLNQHDRAGVIMSYLENRTFAEVGRLLGVSEEAARKRVTRAIQKMRMFFTSRGVPIETATISGAMQAQVSVVPSAAIAASATTSAWAAAIGSGAAASTAPTIIADGARRMIAIAKLKVAATLVVGATAVSVVAIPPVVAVVSRLSQSAPDAKPQPAAASAPVQAGKMLAVTFDNGFVAELQGIANLDGNARKWWNGDGSPTEKACDGIDSNDDPPHTHLLCIRVVGPDGKEPTSPVKIGLSSGNFSCTGTTLNGATIDGAMALSTRVAADAKTLPDVTVQFAAGDWQERVINDHPDGSYCTTVDGAGVMFAPAADLPTGKAMIVATDQFKDAERRLIVIDDRGESHAAKTDGQMSAGGMTQISWTLDIPANQVRSARLLTRAFDHKVVFKNLAISPDKPTKPEVVVAQPAK